jgi:aspartate aminotransferase
MGVATASTLELGLPAGGGPALGAMVSGLVGSEILKIGAEVRALRAAGQAICDLTVGDFSPAQFRIPERLETAIARALAAGHTNYPPADGMPELRRAVQGLYQRKLGLAYPLEGVLIAGGARPALYCAYRAVLDPGDAVVYPVPSWNNNHYTHLCEARGIPVAAEAANGFQPTAEAIAPFLPEARLVVLASPLNPAGTGFSRHQLTQIARLVVAENRRRERAGARPLFLLYDHIYWMVAASDVEHHTPVGLVPEAGPYTIFIDGISKAFAATGLRVGWAVGAPHVISRMKDLLGHIGAWAPRAEQVATAEVLADPDDIEGLTRELRSGLGRRLRALHEGIQDLRAEGFPVDALPPGGGLYLSAHFDLIDRLKTNEAIRKLLLERAGFAVVPFQAFGLREDTGWFRLSAGAVGLAEIEQSLPRVRAALSEALAVAKP